MNVRLCLGRLNPGPTGPWRSPIGAPTESLRSRGWVGSIGSVGATASGMVDIMERGRGELEFGEL